MLPSLPGKATAYVIRGLITYWRRVASNCQQIFVKLLSLLNQCCFDVHQCCSLVPSQCGRHDVATCHVWTMSKKSDNTTPRSDENLGSHYFGFERYVAVLQGKNIYFWGFTWQWCSGEVWIIVQVWKIGQWLFDIFATRIHIFSHLQAKICFGMNDTIP